MGSHGHVLNVDEEYMLIFGGLTYRERYFGENNSSDIFNECEAYESITG